jgi:hypothetical protein
MSITIKSNTRINSRTTVGNYGGTPVVPPVVAYSFSVSPDGNVCSLGNNVTVYSSSAVLGIGSSLYQNSGLTIPTTYGAISNPNDPGQDYFVITVNTITSITLCD